MLWIATTFGHAMTTTAKDERQTAKRETAFFYGFPITTFGNDEKYENRFIFFMDCHKNTSCFFAMTATAMAKATTNDKRQTTKGNKKMTRIVILAIFLFFTSFLKTMTF